MTSNPLPSAIEEPMLRTGPPPVWHTMAAVISLVAAFLAATWRDANAADWFYVSAIPEVVGISWERSPVSNAGGRSDDLWNTAIWLELPGGEAWQFLLPLWLPAASMVFITAGAWIRWTGVGRCADWAMRLAVWLTLLLVVADAAIITVTSVRYVNTFGSIAPGAGLLATLFAAAWLGWLEHRQQRHNQTARGFQLKAEP